jgi:hypothetical protein
VLLNYADISKLTEQLGYRDKLRLAQLLIQLARKEEEEQNPDKRRPETATGSTDPELLQYVSERLRKLKPARKDSVLNSIGAMFQFQGGISETDKEKLFGGLLKKRLIVLTENNRVEYPTASDA